MRRAYVKRGKLLRSRRAAGSERWSFAIEERDQRNPSFVYRWKDEIRQAQRHWRRTKQLLHALGRGWPYGLCG